MSVVAAVTPSVAQGVAQGVALLAQQPIRVMIVDDAVVVRGLVSRWVDAEPDLKIVASLRTGQDALDELERTDPEVVLFDVEMPVLDGMAALPLLLQKRPNLAIIMVSTVTRRNAEVTLKALTLGAADYVPKPETNHEVTTSETFRHDLIEKIRHIGWRRRGRKYVPPTSRQPASALRPQKPFTVEGLVADGNVHALQAPQPQSEIKLRAFAPAIPRVLLIGASTGGPQALSTILAAIGRVIDRAPVLITQHMPIHCTRFLAERLNNICQLQVREGAEGSVLGPGQAWIAPGDQHMVTRRNRSNVTLHLTNDPPENSCRPSADVMFRSIAKTYHNRCLAVVMTGMGKDGLDGCQEIKWHGGRILVQDEETSIAWGMPRAIIKSDLAERIVPLAEMAHAITSIVAAQNVRERRNLITT